MRERGERTEPGTAEGDGRAQDSLARVLAAAAAGDERAFVALYTDVQPRLLRYTAALIGSEAEDVTAEAWLQIARDLRTFSGDMAAFRAWSARIVHNRAMDLVRRRARRPETLVGLDVLLDTGLSPDVPAEAGERAATERALALIGQLPAGQAAAVLLRVVVGLDAAGAAAVLGKRPATVRVAVHRGLRALARRLEPEATVVRADRCNAADEVGAEGM